MYIQTSSRVRALTQVLKLVSEVSTLLRNRRKKKHGVSIPWLVLVDPTSACNLKCTGCWSAEYGHLIQLSYEDLDRIVTEGEELGIHAWLMTGGEPLIRKKDILKLAEAHP